MSTMTAVGEYQETHRVSVDHGGNGLADRVTVDDRVTVPVFGIQIDRLTLGQAAGRLADWAADSGRSCRYVVTPNLDHALMYQENERLRAAYGTASMVVADGWPLVTASRLSGTPLPERVAGSDLVPELFGECERRGAIRTVYLLGAAPGVAEAAAAALERRWGCVQVVGTYSPPLGFQNDQEELDRIAGRINECRPDILVVGFGAPKQELWLHQAHSRLDVGVAIAAGATIDFLAGRQKRAPVWVQKMRLEWTHRLLTNPRRQFRRYLRDACELPRLFVREIME